MATDCPTIDKRQSGAVDLAGARCSSAAPNVNPKVGTRLEEIATQHDIPFQLAALGRAAANDANAMQISRQGVATGLVQTPNRYMHSTVETVAWDDLDNAAELLAQFAAGVGAAAGYIP